MRNIHLATWGVGAAFLGLFTQPEDWSIVRNYGIFSGFNYVVWALVLVQVTQDSVDLVCIALAFHHTTDLATTGVWRTSGCSCREIYRQHFEGFRDVGFACLDFGSCGHFD